MTGPAAWLDASLDLEERVAALLGDLAPAESVSIALGDFAPLTGRGLPEPHYVDSGTGLRDVDGATAFPAGIALAATFDAALAEAYGAAVGAEARSAGYTVVLGPTLDLARDPRGGRIPEALGEDPYLSGLLGAAHVRGLQGQHVIAQLKHFVAYNGEDRRTGCGLGEPRGDSMNVRISTATLQDVYLRPFRMAVEVGAWSMMGSYNRLNGVYACESELLGLPRREWGWQGFYCPDFLFAVRDDRAALLAGLDLGALGGPGGRTAAMVAAAPAGVLTALVGNVVRALIGSGLADHPLDPPAPPSTPEHRALAERTAVAATVLLTNSDAVLPLGPEVGSIAVIGPSGADAFHVVGGSAAVSLKPERVVSPLAGIIARAGARRVEVAQGSLGDVPLPVIPAEAFTLPDGSGPGVEVAFTRPDGTRLTSTVPEIDHEVVLGEGSPGWPGRWRARLTSKVTGAHRLSLTFGGRARVRLDGEVVMVGSRELEQFIHGPRYPMQVVVDLVAGEPALLEIDFEEGPAIMIPPLGLGPTLRLGWQPPDGLLAEAEAVAARCDVAVVLVNQISGEGMDRDSLSLPGDQNELVRRVAAANPRTIVVLNTPGAVLLPWLDEVSAVLQVWYPGEGFGAALAAVLFGDAEPGGRLPLTFPRARAELPGGDHGPETVPMDLDYDADGGIGYRAPGVREHGCAFAFGHGLGYSPTQAQVVGVEIAAGRLRLRLAVRNTGERASVHVAQLYAEVAGESPELVGLCRVPVEAGSVAEAVTDLEAVAFARWCAGGRTPVAGDHRLRIATSSQAPGPELVVTVAGQEIVAVAGTAPAAFG